MPTGFTETLHDGEQAFAAFAMSCARNFGATITMRDDPQDTPIPDEFEASSYHSEGLVKAQSRLVELRSMTLLDAAREARQGYEKWEKARADSQAAAEARVARYKAMLDQVLAWTPPTDEHTGLRDFMVQQLEMSIDYDGPHEWGRPPTNEAKAWLHDATARALDDIAHHAKELREERDRAAARTQWVRDLRRSLETP